MCSNGVWKRERFDARRSQPPVCRQLWTTGRWDPSVGVSSLGSDSGGASLSDGLRSQYPRLAERRDLLPRLRRVQLPPPDHHHLSGHRGHATRALHQDRCGRDHPLRHHLPEPTLAFQLVPGSPREQRGAHPPGGRDADQPRQPQGTDVSPQCHHHQHHRVVRETGTCGGGGMGVGVGGCLSVTGAGPTIVHDWR